MVKHFISLEWKQFKRASYFQKGIAIKILLFLAFIYFGGAALLLGVGLFFILRKTMPDVDPIITVNNYLVYWMLMDLAIRYFMQQLPVMNIKPLMVIPIKKNSVIHYLLGKTVISVFNFIPMFVFIPFSVVLMASGYPVLKVLPWLTAMYCFVLTFNFTNFLINKSNKAFFVILAILAVLVGLEHFEIYKVSVPMGQAFNYMYNNPALCLIPVLLLVGTYLLNYRFIQKGFYLDAEISKKVEKVKSQDLSWMNRFGKVAPFLKNDIKLITRNARPKQVVLISFIFLFYGVVFYTQDIYKDMPAVLVFASIFVTGGFLLTFGQLVPSWDSEYYKMLMSQNIPYRQYLESKWYLMVFGVSISFVLSLPYLYFGTRIYGMIAAGALFNIGLNSFITLIGGALNRVPVELNVKSKAFGNTNGFNPTQLLIGLPKFVLPMLIFYVPYYFISFESGLIALALSGVLGIILKNVFLSKIEAIYQNGKYKTIAAFGEKK
ncbi:MAG: hypothetical protein BM564_02175 [Bacteroidetes bacterium MedPE-SWsnd-G2]|nr:MAG: hypothetical protein BM564_02175 [Bacteroidetes bacterium MedPE-SWsnd-G2]